MINETDDRAVPTERQVTGIRADVSLPEARADGQQAATAGVGNQ